MSSFKYLSVYTILLSLSLLTIYPIFFLLLNLFQLLLWFNLSPSSPLLNSSSICFLPLFLLRIQHHIFPNHSSLVTFHTLFVLRPIHPIVVTNTPYIVHSMYPPYIATNGNIYFIQTSTPNKGMSISNYPSYKLIQTFWYVCTYVCNYIFTTMYRFITKQIIFIYSLWVLNLVIIPICYSIYLHTNLNNM